MMMMTVRELQEVTNRRNFAYQQQPNNTEVNPREKSHFWHLALILPGSAGLCICFLTLSGNDVCWVTHLLQGELFLLVHYDQSRTINTTSLNI